MMTGEYPADGASIVEIFAIVNTVGHTPTPPAANEEMVKELLASGAPIVKIEVVAIERDILILQTTTGDSVANYEALQTTTKM